MTLSGDDVRAAARALGEGEELRAPRRRLFRRVS
jgi:hypothetical protein